MYIPLAALALLPLASAHFVLVYPSSRNGQDDSVESTSPCGNLLVSSNRTSVSSTSFPLALEMGHDESVIQVLLSLSSNPTSEGDFNITLEQTFGQTGLGEFCLPMVMIPESAGVKDGANGTIQVITDGEGGGGLYACADITFTSATSSSAALPSSCKNNTGVTASALPNTINANMSDGDGNPQSGASGSMSMSASGSASGASASASSSSAAEATKLAEVMGWGVLGAVMVGGVGLL